MNESILNTLKKLLGITTEDMSFDLDVITHANSVFMFLNQLGVGTAGVFQITGADELWSDFITAENSLSAVKSYMYMKIRVLFDPPQTAGLMNSFENQIKELEQRLFIQVEELEE